MGASIEFFAAAEDDRTLREFAASIGLDLVSLLFEERSNDLSDAGLNPACYFCLGTSDELHPYGPKRLISDATDPVIEFTRSVHDPPDLIAGRIYWSDDVEEFARLTKGPFRKLVSWIRRNWQRRADGYYAGPRALELVSTGCAVARHFRQGTPVRRVQI